MAARAAEPSRSAGGSFTDITRASGIEEIVNRKYEASPQWWLSGLHLVDLDGDGKLDLFLSAHGGGGAVAALNLGGGRFARAPGDYPTTEIHLAYDIDEDGRVDLSMTHEDGGGRWWLNRSTPGRLAFEPAPLGRGTNTARRQSLIDIDRDGKVDWLRGTPREIVFELGDGRGKFTDNGRPLSIGGNGQGEALCLPVDLDGDGLVDLVTEWGHYGSTHGSRIFHNDGQMHFTDVTRECGLDGDAVTIKGVGDVNQDGSPDLLVLEKGRPEIYLNDGHGKFVRQPNSIVGMDEATRPAAASWGIAIVTDFDNDGVPDILWNGRHFLWVLQGLGGGRFEYMNKKWGIRDMSAASVDDGHCFGDIDGDGGLDIVGYASIDDRRQIAVYHNDLARGHWLNVRPIGAAGNRGAAGAKIRLYAAGTKQLLWYEQVAIYDSQAAASYYSYATTERHFGLGAHTSADVSVEFYPSRKVVERKNAPADSTVEIRE